MSRTHEAPAPGTPEVELTWKHLNLSGRWLLGLGSLLPLSLLYFLLGWNFSRSTLPWTFVALATPLLAVAYAYRIRRLMTARDVTTENRSTFVLEGVIAILISMVLLVQASAHGVPAASRVAAWIVPIFVLTVIVQLWTMWRLQQKHNRSQPLMLIALIGVLMICSTLMAPFGRGLLVGVFSVLGTLFSIIAFPIMVLMSHFESLLHRIPLWQRFREQHTKPHQTAVHYPSSQPPKAQVSHDVMVALGIVLLASLVVYGIVKLRQLKPQHGTDSVEGVEVAIERYWVTGNSSFTLATTSDPVRLRYQRWLQWMHRKGLTITPLETSRQFLQRIRPAQTHASYAEAEELTETYERVRYRNASTIANTQAHPGEFAGGTTHHDPDVAEKGMEQ